MKTIGPQQPQNPPTKIIRRSYGAETPLGNEKSNPFSWGKKGASFEGERGCHRSRLNISKLALWAIHSSEANKPKRTPSGYLVGSLDLPSLAFWETGRIFHCTHKLEAVCRRIPSTKSRCLCFSALGFRPFGAPTHPPTPPQPTPPLPPHPLFSDLLLPSSEPESYEPQVFQR